MQIRSAVESRIKEIASDHEGGKIKIFVLGRYQRDIVYSPRNYDMGRVEVKFITVHSSKGLEADHVILPRITSEMLGFPSRIIDDPVLQLAMPNGDLYEFSEERRLFYVALTRARQTATLITVEGKESTFIKELVRDNQLTVLNADGSDSNFEVCPSCGTGSLVMRKGRYGHFLGCSNYPQCKHTRKVAKVQRVN